MMKHQLRTICLLAVLGTVLGAVFAFPAFAEHKYNGTYTGRNLDKIAFPIGGIGAGMYCLEGTGSLCSLSVRTQMDFFNVPNCFATVTVLGDSTDKNESRVLEGQVPLWKFFGPPNTGLGSEGGSTHGLPRFHECEFQFRFPFAEIKLKDEGFPVEAELLGWSPFTPGDPDSSSYPIGVIEYKLKNTSSQPIKTIFSFNTPNFMNRGGSIGSIEDGFVLFDEVGEQRKQAGSFAFYVRGEGGKRLPGTKVDHCWFRGGWWDPLTIAWNNVLMGRMIDNPPVESYAPGASIAVPVELKPNESQVVRLLTAWYVPKSNLSIGTPAQSVAQFGPVFDDGPSTGPVLYQHPIQGYLGRQFVNTFYPIGDGGTGTLTSPSFNIGKKYIHFLIGGGDRCPVELLVEGKAVRSANGARNETLSWTSWDVAEFAGKEAQIRIVDHETGDWGHVNADHFVASDESIDDLKVGSGKQNDHRRGNRRANRQENRISTDPGRVLLIADFEGDGFESWTALYSDEALAAAKKREEEEKAGKKETAPSTYVPWYATQCKSIDDVVAVWNKNYETWKKQSKLFADTFYDSTLPPEVIEAAAANLSILKSTTVLRQHDGRLWCWEGNRDDSGSCAGSCTHVWNYAQALPHLFPSLERSLRETEFYEGTDANGRQAFRANLPISPGGWMFDAVDGQLGGIMKVYREWKISADKDWLKKIWPQVQLSLGFIIKTFDPRHTGLLEEEHHNTYDINYFGPDGHCGSFYLGALQAAVELGTELGADVSLYKELLEKGKKRMVADLFNGEYFIQIVQKEGLNRNFHPVDPNAQSIGYRDVAKLVNEEGPKYQYGIGCLSDGILGLWIAKVAGVDAEIIDPELVKKHLLAIHKYNFKRDLSKHSNPQRPSFALGDDAGLILCTWPKGGKPQIPFVYSDEVWTGIEYQVASHLMFLGCVEEGLEIVRAVRNRYDGERRNPMNEYECGHWYARAMSSYGLLQGLTGVRYDATNKTLYVDSKIGDFRTFLSTEKGFGTVDFKNGKATIEVKSGEIPVEKTVVAK